MSVNINTVNALYGNNGNSQWKPRKTETVTLSSGQVVQIRRPGQEFMLRAGRVARTFTKTANKAEREEGQSEQEYGLDVIAQMSDEELGTVLIFARELVCAMLVSPKLVLNPRPGSDEIGPDDIGNDFWELFNIGMAGFVGLKVPVGDQEVGVSDLANFRGESGVSGDSVDSAEVRAEGEQPDGHPGLDGSS
jgi:hypothetical protein